MGCCLSKKTEDPSLSSSKGEKNNYGGAGPGGESRDPPPTESPQPQEEKVKEVLSETPKITILQRSARSINVNNIDDINGGGGAKRKTVVDDEDEEYYPATIRSEVETSTSTTAASEQSTTSTKTTFKDKKKKKKKKQPAGGGGGAVAGGGGGGGREMRGSVVVDVGCRSGRSSSSLSSPSPQLLIRAPRNLSSSGGNAAGRVMIRNKCNSNRSPAAPSPMKISGDLGERSRRRSVSPSASASAIKRCANAAPVLPMDQRLCRLMSSSAATPTPTPTPTNRVNNGRYCSPRKIPATTASRPVDLVNADRPAPAPANWSSGKLLEAPHPSPSLRPSPAPGPCPPYNHDHDQAQEQEESLENPLVSLECFIFL